MSVCMYPSRLLITSGMIWTPYDWLNKFYCFYVAVVANIISRCGLSIDAHYRNKPNKSKLVVYKTLTVTIVHTYVTRQNT